MDRPICAKAERDAAPVSMRQSFTVPCSTLRSSKYTTARTSWYFVDNAVSASANHAALRRGRLGSSLQPHSVSMSGVAGWTDVAHEYHGATSYESVCHAP